MEGIPGGVVEADFQEWRDQRDCTAKNLPIPVPIEELSRQLDIIEIQALTTQASRAARRQPQRRLRCLLGPVASPFAPKR